MPRRPRLHLEAVPLYIVQRGHSREPCFFAEEDYSSYLHWLGEALVEAECARRAYVLMTNYPGLLPTFKQADVAQRRMLHQTLATHYRQHRDTAVAHFADIPVYPLVAPALVRVWRGP